MTGGKFEGWYFMHQLEDDTLAFIPGSTGSGSFVQLLTPSWSDCFEAPELHAENDVIDAENCHFSPSSCVIDLPGISWNTAKQCRSALI